MFGSVSTKKEKKPAPKVEKKKPAKKPAAKANIFGDSDSDDDIFGSKPAKKVEKKPAPKAKPAATKKKASDPLGKFFVFFHEFFFRA